MTDCGVYRIRNTRNNRCYVGSSVDIARRWSLHRWSLRHGYHNCRDFQKDWDQDGEEGFSFERIESYDYRMTRKQLEEREELHMTGELYNISKHARGGWKHTEENREFLAEQLRQIAKDPKERERRSAQAKDQHMAGLNRGIPCSEKKKQKISESLKAMASLLKQERKCPWLNGTDG
jgi:group I intron endonuclease